MRRKNAAAIILAVFTLFSISPLSAREGPDCIVVYGLSGPTCIGRDQAKGFKQARYFGTYTKAPKSVRKAAAKRTTVAGKRFTPSPSVSYHSSSAPWLAAAKADVGKSARQLGVPSRLWCADATNKWLRDAGYSGTGSRRAKDFLAHGRRLSGPQPGAIAVYHRGKNGGHVAIVESVSGNTVTLVSGNCGSKGVCRYTRSVGSAIAYVWPS